MAIHIIDTIIFQISTHIHAISIVTIHHKIDGTVSTFCQFSVVIILTKTVDKLTAKHITTGEKIIGIRFQIFRYFRNSTFSSDLSSLKAVSKITNGERVIAIHNIHILSTNTIIIAISGIDTASICHSHKAIFSNET